MTTPSYYVTIDSEFRDDQKYPFPTDFSVKFKDDTTGTQVLGVPSTGASGNVSDTFFTPLQIDPDYYSNQIRVEGGFISKITRVGDNFILCGNINASCFANYVGGFISNFTILGPNDSYIFSTNFVDVNLTYSSDTDTKQEIFVANILKQTEVKYSFEWIIFSLGVGYNVSGPGMSSDYLKSTFNLDSNNNIYFISTCGTEFYLFLISKDKQDTIIDLSQNIILYNIGSSSFNDRTYSVDYTQFGCFNLGLFVFTLDGQIYNSNQHSWGYHAYTSNLNVLPTFLNGNTNILIDNSLNLYVSGNINPFLISLYQYDITLPNSLGIDYRSDSNLIPYTYTNDYIFIYTAPTPTASPPYSFRICIYNAGTGASLLQSNIFTSVSPMTSTTSLDIPYFSTTWFTTFNNTGYFVTTLKDNASTFLNNSTLVLGTVNLTTGVVTWPEATNVYNHTYSALSTANSIRYNQIMYTICPMYNSDGSLKFFKLFKIDLNTIPYSFTNVTDTTTSTNNTTTFTSNVNPYPYLYIDGDVLFIATITTNNNLLIFKMSINTSNFNLTEQTKVEIPNLLPIITGQEILMNFFRLNSKYYILMGFKNGLGSVIVDITDLNNVFIVSEINKLKYPCIIYTDTNNSTFIHDNLTTILCINDPYNPILITDSYPSNFSQYITTNDTTLGTVYKGLRYWSTFNSKQIYYIIPAIPIDIYISSLHYNTNLVTSRPAYTNNIVPISMDTINVNNSAYVVYFGTLNNIFLVSRLAVSIINCNNLGSVITLPDPFNIINENDDPDGLYYATISQEQYNLVKTLLFNNYIYLFCVFQTNCNSIDDTNLYSYLCVVKLNLDFEYVTSTYIKLSDPLSGDFFTIKWYTQNILVYTQNNNIYVIIQNIDKSCKIYLYQNNTLTEKSSFILFDGDSFYDDYIQTAGALLNDPQFNSQIVFYPILVKPENISNPLNSAITTINITDPENPIKLYLTDPIFTRLGNFGCNRESVTTRFEPNEPVNLVPTVYIYIKPINSTKLYVFRTIYQPLFDGISLTLSYTPETYPSYSKYFSLITSWYRFDNLSPISIHQNPLTDKWYLVSSSTPLPEVISTNYYIVYQDITNLLILEGSYCKTITYDTLTYQRAYSIRTIIYNQSVYCTVNYVENDSLGGLPIEDVYFEISNIEYAMKYSFISPTITGQYPQANVSTYSFKAGSGGSFINKLTNEGDSLWFSSIGSNSNTLGTFININDIVIDPSLTYLYAVGGWKNNIETFNPNGDKVNSIVSSYTDTYNSYFLKINLIKDGTFEWVIPCYGTLTTTFEGLNYINSKNEIAIVVNYNSPLSVVYESQLSKTGSFTNPIGSLLNLSNTSTTSSSLISITSAGKLSFSCKLYSTISLRIVYLYDLSIDETTSNKTIKVVGKTNTTILQSIDSSNTNNQNLYINIDPLTQQAIMIYCYDLNGNYKYSNKVEFPANITPNIIDISSSASTNQFAIFPYFSTSTGTSQDLIKIYNKDGTLANTINDYIINSEIFNCYVIQYYYDPTYTDVNGVSYSKVVLQDSFNFSNESLVNYHLFIQGNLFDSYTGTTTQIADTTTLNKNFTIRHNFIENSKDTLILNQVIDIKNIVRKNLSYQSTDWAGSISPSELPGIISYNNTVTPTNPIIITALYGLTSINTSSTGYYLMYATGTELNYVTINSITYSNGIYQMNITNPSQALNQDLPPGVYYGPYIYFTQTNKQAYYTLQFSPGTIYDKVYYNLKLNSLVIPNRRITSSFLSGTRTINDFRYIYLEVYNEDDNGQFDTGIANNYFTNNQNFAAINQRTKTLFEIPIAGVSVNSDTNFVVLSNTSNIPILVISPGYNNFHVRLVDMYGNLITFDPTPNTSKASDSIFSGNVVNTSLMQVAANFTFTKITK
jgi:hypothetical protein